jgi:hypothetical protein
MTRILRKLLGFFVPDTMLAAFVPVWIAVIWAATHVLPHAPAPLATLMTLGPIVALWFSVHTQAGKIRAACTDGR